MIMIFSLLILTNVIMFCAMEPIDQQLYVTLRIIFLKLKNNSISKLLFQTYNTQNAVIWYGRQSAQWLKIFFQHNLQIFNITVLKQ